MIVADEDGIDLGKIIPRNPRFSPASRTNPRQRTCSLRPNWVGQNIRGRLLQEHGRVVHQRDAQSVTIHVTRRFGFLDIGQELRRWFRAAGQLPEQSLINAGQRPTIRIVVAPSIKMFREHFLIVRRLLVTLEGSSYSGVNVTAYFVTSTSL